VSDPSGSLSPLSSIENLIVTGGYGYVFPKAPYSQVNLFIFTRSDWLAERACGAAGANNFGSPANACSHAESDPFA